MIVAGFGFRKSATEASLRDALAQAAAEMTVDYLAAPADKCAAAALRGLARELGTPILPVAPANLSAQITLTQSGPSRRARATGSVAEAAALAAAGPDARLASPRKISEDRLATCCVALGKNT